MKILYYSWDEMICVDVMEAFKELDCQVRKVRFDHKSDFFDADFQKYIEACLTEEEYDFLFSINYIPVLALAAFNKKIRYVSWVYDCPCGTMYSETIKSPYNIVFDFDEAEVLKFNSMNINNVFHLPLAASIDRMENTFSKAKEDNELYKNDIAFVAKISSNESYFKDVKDIYRGYLDAIVKSQSLLHGDEVVENFVKSAKGIEIAKYFNFEKNDTTIIRDCDLLEILVNRELRRVDRLEIAKLLEDKVSKKFKTALYTDYDKEDFKDINKGVVDSYKGQYLVYKNSKININQTIRSIKSAINQRSVDILACKGFLLTNYSHEAYRDLELKGACVIYYDYVDLERKIEYFMEHEEQRLEIASKGYNFYKNNRTYKIVLGKMLEKVGKM